MKVRKRPVVVDAVTISEIHYQAAHNWHALPDWVIKGYDDGNLLFLNDPSRVEIITLEGTMTGEYNDWLIRGITGELYPCKHDIFLKTYEVL